MDGDVVKETVDTGEQDGNLDLGGKGLELALLEELSKTSTTVQGVAGRSVKVRTKLREGSKLTVLGEVELERTSDRLVDLGLGRRTDTRDRETDVDSGTDTLEEELRLKEDLAVGNRNDVGRNEGRNVTTLGLNDGEGSERARAVVLVQLGSTLKETRVQVEDITGVRLTAGGTACLLYTSDAADE